MRARDQIDAAVLDALVLEHQLPRERRVRGRNAEQRGAHAVILRRGRQEERDALPVRIVLRVRPSAMSMTCAVRVRRTQTYPSLPRLPSRTTCRPRKRVYARFPAWSKPSSPVLLGTPAGVEPARSGGENGVAAHVHRCRGGDRSVEIVQVAVSIIRTPKGTGPSDGPPAANGRPVVAGHRDAPVAGPDRVAPPDADVALRRACSKRVVARPCPRRGPPPRRAVRVRRPRRDGLPRDRP